MKVRMAVVVVATWCLMCGLAFAKAGFYDLPVNTSVEVTTMTGVELPRFYGPPEHYYAIFKIWPVVPGKKYEATLTYDAGDDMGFGVSWIDGDPSGQDSYSFVGIGTGTGTKYMPGAEKKYIFSVSPESTSNVIYMLVRSHRPWKIKFSVTDRLSGVTKNSQDKWGYYYVDEFPRPFLLKRGGMMVEKIALDPTAGGVQIYGPFKIVTPSFRGTLKLLRYTPQKGVAWLRVEGTGVEEILEVEFKGEDFSFIRTLDCRFGKDRPIFQKFTGTFLGSDFIQGGFSGSDQPGSIIPWQGQRN
ncbi:MAG TPA: hypothetical protein PLT64_09670 [Syntrophales bacterium]|nr:hypothetical protein [Syntrophales bacterium]HPO36193.1 hypothetical protein [Syntrophales bacterium]